MTILIQKNKISNKYFINNINYKIKPLVKSPFLNRKQASSSEITLYPL